MELKNFQNQTDQPPPRTGRFSWKGFCLAAMAAPALGAVLAWLAELTQHYFSPIVLFPILIGVFAGAGIVTLARLTRIGHRLTLLCAAALAAGVATAGLHYCAYLTVYFGPGASVKVGKLNPNEVSEIVGQTAPSFLTYMNAEARRGRPILGDYAARDGLAWLTWAADVVLAIAGAVLVVVPAIRVPYCNKCATWYRTVRCKKSDSATAKKIAELIGVDGSANFQSPRCRLSACQGGCGPTCCELSWETADGAIELAWAWLSAAERNQVAAILDDLEKEDEDEDDQLPSNPPPTTP